jgi:hypothetical protein
MNLEAIRLEARLGAIEYMFAELYNVPSQVCSGSTVSIGSTPTTLRGILI